MTTTSLLLTQFGGSASADVDAPADRVFGLTTDVARVPEWNARIPRVLEPARRPLQPGAEWVVQMQVAGTRWPSRSTAVTHDVGQHRFEYTSRSDGGNPSSTHWRCQVTPVPGSAAGSTSAGSALPAPSGGERCSVNSAAARSATKCRPHYAPSPRCTARPSHTRTNMSTVAGTARRCSSRCGHRGSSRCLTARQGRRASAVTRHPRAAGSIRLRCTPSPRPGRLSRAERHCRLRQLTGPGS